MDDRMSHQNDSDSLDLLWGAEAIGAYINTGRRQTFYLLATGKLPARKVGNLWVASRMALRRHLLGEEGS